MLANLWRVSDCETLVGVTHRGWWGWFCGGHYCISPFKYLLIYQRTNNVAAIRRLLGQSSVTATSAYLGVSDNSALELARTINIW